MRFVFLAMIAAASLSAAPITDLLSTGSSTPGTADPNWTVDGVQAFTTLTSAYPFPLWATSVDARWISRNAHYNDGGTDPGDSTFMFATKFTLPANYVSAFIGMRIATDNGLLDVKLNGVSLAFPTVMMVLPGNGSETPVIAAGTGFQGGPGDPLSFDHNAGMVAGENTVEFYVRNSYTNSQNDGNPAGLMVAFSTEMFVDPGDPVHAPEPSTIGLMAVGLGIVAVRTARRRRA